MIWPARRFPVPFPCLTFVLFCSVFLFSQIDMWTSKIPVHINAAGGASALLTLHAAIEKIAVFAHATNAHQHQQAPSKVLSLKYAEYANMLASQGDLRGAFNYLSRVATPNDPNSAVLLDRIFHAEAEQFLREQYQIPAFPFQPENIQADPTLNQTLAAQAQWKLQRDQERANRAQAMVNSNMQRQQFPGQPRAQQQMGGAPAANGYGQPMQNQYGQGQTQGYGAPAANPYGGQQQVPYGQSQQQNQPGAYGAPAVQARPPYQPQPTGYGAPQNPQAQGYGAQAQQSGYGQAMPPQYAQQSQPGYGGPAQPAPQAGYGAPANPYGNAQPQASPPHQVARPPAAAPYQPPPAQTQTTQPAWGAPAASAPANPYAPAAVSPPTQPTAAPYMPPAPAAAPVPTQNQPGIFTPQQPNYGANVNAAAAAPKPFAPAAVTTTASAAAPAALASPADASTAAPIQLAPAEQSLMTPLENCLNALAAVAGMKTPELKKVSEIRSKLQDLAKRLQGHELSPTAMAELQQLVNAVAANDYTAAQKHHLNLVKTDWASKEKKNSTTKGKKEEKTEKHNWFLSSPCCLFVLSLPDNNEWLLGLKTMLLMAKKYLEKTG
jgi:hypothetical protein